jgi:hypothetical protein
MSSSASLSAELTSDEMGNPNNLKHIDTVSMCVSFHDSLINEVDKQMRRQNRHILMFLDNASSHAKDLKLNNVILKFLPANTTSHLQPLPCK